jgi:LysM repeat protein
MWSLVTGLPTINGNGCLLGRMRRLPLTLVLVLSCLLTGCAGKNQPTPTDDLAAAKRHLDRLLSETRADAEAMRAEMANTRIAVAKQEAELKELRQEAVERRQMVDARQTELNAIRTERDRLLQAKTDLHAQLQTQIAEVSRLRATASQVEIAHVRVAELESQLAARITELNQTKNELEQQAALIKGSEKPAKVTAKSKKLESAKSDTARTRTAPITLEKPSSKLVSPEPTRPAEEKHPGTAGGSGVRLADLRNVHGSGARVLVQPGDSLKQIAKRHSLTVDQLKQVNGLDGDQIEPGQFLIIPPTQSTP